MIRRVVAVVAATSMLFTSAPASADSRCYGCNIVDTGLINNLYVNDTLYIDDPVAANERVRVLAVDGQSVLIKHANGNEHWHQGRELYGSAEIQERDSAAVGVGIAAVVLGAIIAGSSGSSNSSGSNSDYHRQESSVDCSNVGDNDPNRNNAIRNSMGCD